MQLRKKPQFATWNHNLVLALLAALSAGSHWFGVVQTAPILTLYREAAHLDLVALDARHAASSLSPSLRLLIAFVLLTVFYGAGWRLVRQQNGKIAWAIVLSGGLLMAAVELMLYPLDAADIFDNIMHGRILGIYGANPFVDVAQQFAADPFLPYVGWKDSPSAYGPAWELLAAVAARLAGDDLLVNLFMFKLLPGLFWLGTLWCAWLLLRRHAPAHALEGLLLLAWNPLILFATFGNGHNDIALAFCVVAAVALLADGRYSFAVHALTLGMLIKFISVLLVPAAALFAWQKLSNPARIRFIAVAGGGAFLLCLLFYWPFWEGVKIIGIGRRAYYLTTSLPAFLYYGFLAPLLGNQAATRIVSSGAALLTFGFAFWQTGQLRQQSDWPHFTRVALSILMFYLLFTCLWFQPWYGVWVVALAALVPAAPIARLALFFSCAVIAKTVVWVPLWTSPPVPPKVWRELRLGPATMLPVWLYALHLSFGWHRSGRKDQPRNGSQEKAQARNQAKDEANEDLYPRIYPKPSKPPNSSRI